MIVTKVKVLPKGQITLPRKIRDKLGIREGDILFFEEENGELRLKKAETIFDYIGIISLKEDINISDLKEEGREKMVEDELKSSN